MKALSTPYEENRKGDEWDIYPRPQLKRDSYYPMNGEWDLYKNDAPVGKIMVPYPPESRLSRVEQTLEKGDRWQYIRWFSVPEEIPVPKTGEKLMLHFGAVDQIARVYCNGILLRSHEGGYLPFSVDITSAIHLGDNMLAIEVEDDHIEELPLGKQSLKRGGMWYTAHSGIWQSVWMEILPEKAITGLETECTLFDDHAEVLFRVEGGEGKKVLEIDGHQYDFSANTIRVTLDDPKLWTVETPCLYDYSITTATDSVSSYLALRTIDIRQIKTKDGKSCPLICLNGKTVFLHGLLDQGYYPDGIVLPATPGGYKNDIAAMKRLGFNLLRKHIKIEPEVYYYECDRQGMLVMQDFVNSGHYSFIVDTGIPTLGLQKGLQHKASPRRAGRFETDARETIRLLKNHPCIMGFTIFNEGWGQYEASRIYSELKRENPQLLFDTASGWFKGVESDFISDHIYFKKIQMTPDPEGKRPLVLSEYGGYVWSVPEHRFNEEKEYGYKKYPSGEELQKGLETLFTELIPSIQKGLCCAILTQVSDVEDETNGLLTYDRKVVKVDEEKMRAASERLQKALKDICI